MGFTIICNKCQEEVEINQKGAPNQHIFTHSYGILCENCGNKVQNNLIKEYFFQLDTRCNWEIREQIIRIHTYTDLKGYELEWAESCLSRTLGILDAALTIQELQPITTVKTVSTWEDLIVAILKCSYTYDNLLSLLHDLLDNIGFIYGIKVLNKNQDDKFALSFHGMFPSRKNLSPLSRSAVLNQALTELYNSVLEYTDRDNKNKHKFSSGLVHLKLQNADLADYTDHQEQSISIDKACNDVEKIKDTILPLALSCVVQLIHYKK